MLANIPAAIALDRAYLSQLRGDADTTAAFASQALGEAEGEWMLNAITQGILAVAEWLRGRLDDAERLLSSAIDQWRPTGQPILTSARCQDLAQVQRAQGRLDAAAGTYQEALEITAPPGRPALPAAGAAHVGLAEVAYQRNELDAALRHLTEGIPLCRQFVYTPPLATGLATLAWIRQANGDTADALEAMGEAVRAAPGPAVASLLNPVPAQRARLLLAHGEVAAAALWAQQQGLGPDDEPSYQREPEYLVLARVLLGQNRPTQALGLLGRLHNAATAQGRAGSVIEIRALQALALAASGGEDAAVDALAQALTLACPQGYVRVFADEGAPMSALLTRLVAAHKAEHAAARGIPPGYLAQLLSTFGGIDAAQGARNGAAPAVPGLAGQLSARELEVLALLATGKANQAIADELVITLDTVKRHVTHILGKLGVANRTAAVTRARELGLLQ